MKISIKKIIFTLFFFLGFIYFTSPVQAHLDEILDVDLSFEQELEGVIVRAAQDFFNTTQQPIKFDILAGKYAVHFQGEKLGAKQYVLLDLNSYEATGFYNENLLGQGQEKKSSQQLLEKAKTFFQNLDLEGKDELRYTGVSDGVFAGVYRYTWHRFIDDYLVIGEEFKIDIDSRNENIITWDLSIFDVEKENIDFTNAMSFDRAYKIFTYLDKNAQLIKDFNPILLLRDNKLEWDFYVQSKNTIVTLKYYVGIDAHTGEISYKNNDIGNEGIYPMQYFVPKYYDKIYDLASNNIDLTTLKESSKSSFYLNLILIFSFIAIVILAFLIIKERILKRI